jgi:transcriptional regulator with XRE-family HTH domain
MTEWWKSQIAVDTSGNHIEVLTLKQAANYLGVTKSELKLQLYYQQYLPKYKVFSKKGSRVIRIKKKDLDDFKVDTKMYERISQRITDAREKHVHLVTGMNQQQLADACGLKRENLNRIERGKERVGLRNLKRLGKVLDKPLEYFLD